MSTNFPITDSHVIIGGKQTLFANWAGRDAIQVRSGLIDFTVTGTDCTISVYSFGSTISVQVDGGAPSTPSVSAAWANIPVFSGLSDTAHVVRIRVATTDLLDKDNLLTVTGGSPALSVSSGLANTNWFVQDYTSYFCTDGSQDFDANGLLTGSNDSSIRFKATCTSIRIYVLDIAQKFRVYVDGVDHGSPVTFANTGVFDWYEMANSLDGGAEHEYRIFLVGTTRLWDCYNVMTVGGSANVSSTLTPHECWAFYGDSITTGLIGTVDSSVGFPLRIGVDQEVGVRNLGISGTKVVGSGNSGEARTVQVTGISPAVARVVILYGVNDSDDAGFDAGVFETSYTNMLDQLVAGLPGSTPINCFTPTNTTIAAEIAHRTACNTAVSNAVASESSSFVTYSSTDNVINPIIDCDDGLHPNAGGFALLAAFMLSEINGGGGVVPQTMHHYSMMAG